MGERIIDPKFNIQEVYRTMNILNPYRFGGGASPSLMPQEANLIRFYKFNETTGDAIDETGTQNALVTGEMVRDGVKYTGNGTDARVNALNTSEGTSYSIALKLITGSNINNLCFLAVKRNTNSDRSIYLHIYQNNLIYLVNQSGAVSYPIQANSTYDVVITVGEGVYKIYIDKVLFGSNTIPNSAASKTNLFLFGRSDGYFAAHSLDYFAIWDIELTQSDIDKIPNGTI